MPYNHFSPGTTLRIDPVKHYLNSNVAGGNSIGCPDNAGAAGTFYDCVPRSLTVSNHHRPTYTDTLLMDFPQPFLTNVYIRNQAKAAVPLLWSRVQVSEDGVTKSYLLSFALTF